MQPVCEFIYLASQSPRRQELLKQIDVRYQLLLPDENEDMEALEVIHEGEDPISYVKRVTLLKLKSALTRHQVRQLPHAPILCADTTVALDQQILGKPENNDHACHILARLQNAVHQVHSAVAVILPQCEHNAVSENDPFMSLRVSTSNVHVAAMTKAQIMHYVQSGESMDKAGAYAIQGRMATYIERIEGSYSGIVGLPLFETAQLLQWAQVKQST